MENTNNQEVMSSKDKLLKRLGEKYPDKRFNGQIGQDGQIVQDSTEDLEQAILDIFDENAAIISENNSKNEQLINLMCSDPRCSEFVQKWIESGDPRAALVDSFGDDLEELSSEEGRGKFKDELEGWRKRKAENDAMDAEAEANWQASLDALDAWGNEHNLSNEQKAQIIGRLMTITANGLMNKYLPADFDMVVKETNFDTAVAEARRAGEIEGRNAKIKAERVSSEGIRKMPPSLNGGQGMRVRPDKVEKKINPWDEVE